MENGVFRTVDEDSLLREVREIGRSISGEHDGAHRAADALQPYLERMYWRCVKQDVGINRYARVPELP
jgi:hypothetical protein